MRDLAYLASYFFVIGLVYVAILRWKDRKRRRALTTHRKA